MTETKNVFVAKFLSLVALEVVLSTNPVVKSDENFDHNNYISISMMG